jgi:hypothetical protein
MYEKAARASNGKAVIMDLQSVDTFEKFKCSLTEELKSLSLLNLDVVLSSEDKYLSDGQTRQEPPASPGLPEPMSTLNKKAKPNKFHKWRTVESTGPSKHHLPWQPVEVVKLVKRKNGHSS